jgi:hypothetical protein
MHFVGGENSALRAWTLTADGTTAYQAGSNEIASTQAARPPGGMPGWGIALAANQGRDGIIVAIVPHKDSNMAPSPLDGSWFTMRSILLRILTDRSEFK